MCIEVPLTHDTLSFLNFRMKNQEIEKLDVIRSILKTRLINVNSSTSSFAKDSVTIEQLKYNFIVVLNNRENPYS